MELQESNKERDIALLLDISMAGNSAQACQLADEFVARLSEGPVGSMVDINAGDLLLTRGVLTKLKQQIQRAGATLGTMYATVPQTQQAALDEGLFVKEKLVAEWTPIRQPLPLKSAKSKLATQPISPKIAPKAEGATNTQGAEKSVELPDFSQPRPAGAAKGEDFEAVAPQSLDIPELGEVAVELISDEDLALESEIIEEEIQQELVYPDAGFETLYLRQNLRSGQTVRFNGNIVIVGDVHAGSEITAGGDILVWGELRGIAHAGAQGNFKSEIRAMKIEALQLRIADYIARRPDRIYYHKEGAEHGIAPEMARVADGEIKIFKTMLSKI